MNSLLYRCLPVLALVCASLVQADTLAGIYKLALQNDAKLKQAEATYRANSEVENQAFSALLPQVNGTAQYSKTNTYASGRQVYQLNGPVTSVTDAHNISEGMTYNVALTQTLFNLSTWFKFKSGKQTTKQAESQLAYEQQDLIVRVAEAYFNVLRALDTLEATKAEERATKRRLEQTQQRFDVGLIAITDVHEARAKYDLTVASRLTAEGALGTSYEALTVLTGQPHNDLWLLSKDFPIVKPDPVARDQWVQFALKNNNSLKAVTYAADAAEQTAEAAKMNHAPTVTGSIVYNDNYQDGESTNRFTNITNPLDVSSNGLTYSIQLSVPFYSGGGVSATRRQAYDRYNAAQEQKILTQRTVIQTTRAQLITVVNDVQGVKARKQAIISTKSALDATQAGYEVGTRNIVDVFQAQGLLYSAIRDYANARYDYILNMLKLKLAAGTLSPQDIYNLNKWLVSPDSPEGKPYQAYLK